MTDKLTKDFKETIRERMERDPEFTRALILETHDMVVKIDGKLDLILDKLEMIHTGKPFKRAEFLRQMQIAEEIMERDAEALKELAKK